jgi:membrane protein required for beta-lactamase induction
MVARGAPRSDPWQENPELTTSIRRVSRRSTRRDDLETVGLLAGVLGILLMAVVIFGATSPLA